MYYGKDPRSIADALCDAANGGQILISEKTLAEIGTIEALASGKLQESGGRLQGQRSMLGTTGKSKKASLSYCDLRFHIVHLGAHYLNIIKTMPSTKAERKGAALGVMRGGNDAALADEQLFSNKLEALHDPSPASTGGEDESLGSALHKHQPENVVKAQAWQQLLESGKHDIIEVVPKHLEGRRFGPLGTVRQLSPSFYEAPDNPVTFAFTYIDGAKCALQPILLFYFRSEGLMT